MLNIRNLTTQFIDNLQQPKNILHNVSFEIKAGEIYSLIGESGSGKTTTGLAIMRLLPKSASFARDSQIEFHGRSLLDLPEQAMRKVRGADISMIFQDPMTSLNPILTIGVQISEVLKLHRQLHGRQCYIEVLRLLDAMRIADAVRRYNCYPHELSGGMKQRIMIAMAIACKPSLLIADEPTTALDVTTQAEILHLLQELQRTENMALLLITHNMAVAAHMADRIGVIHNGQIVEQNSTQQIFREPQHAYTRKLLSSLPGLFELPTDPLAKQQPPILKVRDLEVHFPIKQGFFRRTVGYVKAVDGISFAVNAGETLAIVGESGSGKTTVAKSLVGLYPECRGIIDFAGTNLLTLNTKQQTLMHHAMQIIFQDPYSALNPKLRIIDSLTEGLLALKIYPRLNDCLTLIDQLLVQVGLDPAYKMRYPHELSGGERQRICIARALSVDPKIIICDEPTSSLDVPVQMQILNLLHKLQVKKNLTYVFISHDFALVRLLAHQVAVMYEGKIVEHGAVQTVLTNPQHEYTKRLLAADLKIEF